MTCDKLKRYDLCMLLENGQLNAKMVEKEDESEQQFTFSTKNHTKLMFRLSSSAKDDNCYINLKKRKKTIPKKGKTEQWKRNFF